MNIFWGETILFTWICLFCNFHFCLTNIAPQTYFYPAYSIVEGGIRMCISGKISIAYRLMSIVFRGAFYQIKSIAPKRRHFSFTEHFGIESKVLRFITSCTETVFNFAKSFKSNTILKFLFAFHYFGVSAHNEHGLKNNYPISVFFVPIILMIYSKI